MEIRTFTIPLWLDLTAAFVGALSGATAASHRKYDIIGGVVLAIAAGLGGALMRDGLFIQNGPPGVLRRESYILVCVVTALLMPVFKRWSTRATLLAIGWTDTLALGLYGMIGTQTALASGLGIGPSMIAGMINAVGGGLVRDLIINEEPMVFKPGNYYAATVLVGSGAFIFCTRFASMNAFAAGVAGAAIIVGLRALAIRYDLRTGPIPE